MMDVGGVAPGPGAAAEESGRRSAGEDDVPVSGFEAVLQAVLVVGDAVGRGADSPAAQPVDGDGNAAAVETADAPTDGAAGAGETDGAGRTEAAGASGQSAGAADGEVRPADGESSRPATEADARPVGTAGELPAASAGSAAESASRGAPETQGASQTGGETPAEVASAPDAGDGAGAAQEDRGVEGGTARLQTEGPVDPDRGAPAEDAREASAGAAKEENGSTRTVAVEGRAGEVVERQEGSGPVETGARPAEDATPLLAGSTGEASAETEAARGAGGGTPAESIPEENRGAVVDQVVRSARLHLEAGSSRFELRLEPPSLGRVGVVLDLKDGTLSVSFRVENEAVRELLQNSMPQLRAALAGHGVSLGELDVSTSQEGTVGQGRAEEWTGAGGTGAAETGSGAEGSRDELGPPRPAARVDAGLIDYWA